MIVALSFLPVFALDAQEGKMFSPLAFTKTWSMVAAALLSITLVPVLITLLVRGRIRPEAENPVNRAAMALYRPAIEIALRRPWTVVTASVLLVLATAWPFSRLGSEFMPELDEGDLRSNACLARPDWRRPRPIRRHSRCSRPRSGSSRVTSGARA
jgi:Cu(I)/Ag(I) efflux system membrane protein CusA/SilA